MAFRDSFKDQAPHLTGQFPLRNVHKLKADWVWHSSATTFKDLIWSLYIVYMNGNVYLRQCAAYIWQYSYHP